MFIDTNGEVWYDINEAAKGLNLKNSLVYRRAKEGHLETTKIITQDTIGRTRELVMFSKKSVEDYKKRHKKYGVHMYDKKSVEDLEIDRICHELLDGCWNWMCDHMDAGYALKQSQTLTQNTNSMERQVLVRRKSSTKL